MKIGILTFHYAHNYGAVLQAYALKHKLEMYNQEVEIIDYENGEIKKTYQKKLTKKNSIKYLKRPHVFLKNLKFDINKKYAQSHWEEQWEKFNDFIDLYLINEQKYKKIMLVGETFEDYDALIVGSDQIWCSDLTGGLDPIYFLDFPYSGIRVSYAASMNRDKILETEKNLITYYLEKFDYISVREDSLADRLNELGFDTDIVVDPTLLLSSKEYSEIESNREEKEYIFAYYVTEDDTMKEIAHNLAKEKNLKLYELHYYHWKKFDDSYQYANLGPGDFLTMIKNAEFVITNSFHGTVFALIYHVNFFSYGNNNIRIKSLLNRLGLSDRYGKLNNINAKEIDWKNVDKKLVTYREKSEIFLKKFLTNQNRNNMYVEKKECCGCHACYNVCPYSAIDMITDSEGFLYPKVRNDKCVNCGLCKKVCAFQTSLKGDNC